MKSDSLNSLIRSALERLPQRSILAYLTSMCLTACQTVPYLPAFEFERFTALPKQERIMQTVKVNWEAQANVAETCVRIMRNSLNEKDRDQAYITPPIACAVWYVSRQECTIYTALNVSQTVLGHELRHCFEGHFHP